MRLSKSNRFSKKIGPYVEREMDLASNAVSQRDFRLAFSHLESAHVLGQQSTYWHTLTHMKMLGWALRTRSFKEAAGQVVRIIGAASKTALGLVPQGNTGGSNVSPFKKMPLSDEHAKRIAQANSKD
jgi:hypothetical protein